MAVIHFQDYGVRRRDAVCAPRKVENPIASMFREWRRRARERGQLAKLDDRMLQDIGLTRADAEFVINKPFWRE